MTKLLPSAGSRRVSQDGFSLIELMIAITLGLMIMTGLVSIFVKNSQARTEIERSNRQLESGRYAISVLSDDLRMAGFLGAFNPYELIIYPTAPPLSDDTVASVAAITTLPDPCATDVASLNNSFFFHVQGYDNAATVPSCVTDARAGSDILVIRRVASCTASPLETGCDALPAGAPYFQSSNCYQATELAKNSGGAASATDYRAHFVLDTNTANATRRAIDCSTIAEYRRYLTRIYYVANNNEGSDGIPTLKRAELGAGSFSIVPLAEGIETLQFEYGVDADDNGAVDGYSADPSLANCGLPTANALTALQCWLRVYAVKVNLLARNVEKSAGHTDNKVYTLGRKADGSSNLFPASGTYGDAYKRHAYNATVRLDNPSGRRLP